MRGAGSGQLDFDCVYRNSAAVLFLTANRCCCKHKNKRSSQRRGGRNKEKGEMEICYTAKAKTMLGKAELLEHLFIPWPKLVVCPFPRPLRKSWPQAD